MKLPAKEYWGEIHKDDLDAQYALKDFLGKSFEEAKEMFKYNALHHGESLMAMPYTPFNFYAPAMAEYIVSVDAKNDSDGASAFLERNMWLFQEYPELVSPETKKILIQASEYVANNQMFYDADIDIYGKFEDKLVKFKQVFKEDSNE